MSRIGKYLILILAIAAAGYCHVELGHRLNSKNLSIQDQTWLPKFSVVHLISFGYEKLWADLYWLAFIQYIGDQKVCMADHYAKSYEYLDLVTRLDPHFILPYWFAAFVVGSDMQRPDLAAKIIERGIENNQNNWFFPYIAGVNQYLFAKNEVKAAWYYKMAAKFPNAPDWIGRQVKILEAKIPSQIKEIGTWTAIYNSQNENSMVRITAFHNLVRLWSKIYKQAPNENIKKRASQELQHLGISPN